jgi:hypothetical protein
MLIEPLIPRQFKRIKNLLTARIWGEGFVLCWPVRLRWALAPSAHGQDMGSTPSANVGPQVVDESRQARGVQGDQEGG